MDTNGPSHREQGMGVWAPTGTAGTATVNAGANQAPEYAQAVLKIWACQ